MKRSSADSADLLPLLLLYEATSAEILPLALLYEADLAAILAFFSAICSRFCCHLAPHVAI